MLDQTDLVVLTIALGSILGLLLLGLTMTLLGTAIRAMTRRRDRETKAERIQRTRAVVRAQLMRSTDGQDPNESSYSSGSTR